REARRAPRALLPALGILAVVPVLLGWTLSQASPAWALRYVAVVLAPALLLAAIGLAGARRLGLAALGAVVLLWATTHTPPEGGNIVRIARTARPMLARGDLVVSVAPAQAPLLAYYLPRDVRFATPFGLDRDP